METFLLSTYLRPTSTRVTTAHEVVIRTTTTTWIVRHQDLTVTTIGGTTTISTRTGHKVWGIGGEGKTEEVSRQTTSERMQGEMTDEEEDSRGLASFGWTREGAKLRTLASIPIPDDRLSFLLPCSC